MVVGGSVVVVVIAYGNLRTCGTLQYVPGNMLLFVMNCTCCYQRGVVVAKGWLNADGSTVVQTPNNTQKKED